MARLCERPGCSEPGAVAYGMVPEDLLFWIVPLADAPLPDPNVLCRRHADTMVVPRGWTLDDRRDALRLFRPPDDTGSTPRHGGARRRRSASPGEQLQIDGTGEIPRPEPIGGATPLDDHPAPSAPDATAPGGAEGDAHPVADPAPADDYEPWQPDFDHRDDLDGLLQVSSPLLSRAFRGTDRRQA